ncbi:MAG: 30S ribosome-binding factor RbfA [Rikenellaceae bacterium]|nr:30S ribosome-binding factor RbfA [Rikenellaceae bacterium]MBR6495538.1 30S ribosome-binding factor RbfA [Rikenellaceae bacterium]
MEQQESTRQQKISSLIRRDISDIFLKEARDLVQGAMVSVTIVRVSPDLSFAKIYLSVFPYAKADEIVNRLTENVWLIRRALGQRVRNQLRIVPELDFRLDDSLEYIENIDNLLKK